MQAAPYEKWNRLVTQRSQSLSKHGNTVAVQGMNIKILQQKAKIKYCGKLIIFKNAVQVEFPTPHEMRVGNIHEPQAGVDVTRQYLTEGQTETL